MAIRQRFRTARHATLGGSSTDGSMLGARLSLAGVFRSAISRTVYSESIDYEFRNPSYAEEFAELNVDANWVKIVEV